MDYLGAQMSIAGGIDNAVRRGVEAGCSVIQVFTQNSNRWAGKAISDADVRSFQSKRSLSTLQDVVSHAIYLINLAAPPGEVRDKSLVAFAEEMRRCARLGIGKIVLHPGACTDAGEEVGIARIVAAFDTLFQSVSEFSGTILLETTAGQGSCLGHRFEHLQRIISNSAHSDRFGVCLDTCHVYAAGYDISTESGYLRTFKEFDDIIGINRLLCFHLNDSKKGVGSRVDRHDHIGKGVMGLLPFRLLLNDPRFRTISKILETPKGDADEMDAVNLATLRGLIEG